MGSLQSYRRNSLPRRHLFRSMVVALALATTTALPLSASADVSVGIGVSVGVPPPPLPVYVQPAIPAPGYIWVPGYWAWDGDDYYWVPGTWVMPPYVGALWTPGYWGWVGTAYIFHVGYWGPHVGFYGGINYGFGYTGVGYAGGYWRGRDFYYNRSVNRIDNVHITNVYNRTVVNNVTVNRTSFNGGQGGITARATPQQENFARQRHAGPVAAQEQQRNLASQNQAMRASFNHGAPSIAATPRAGAFNEPGVAAAHGARGQPAPASMGAQPINTPVQQPRENMALHSAGFAPHNNGPMNAPNGERAGNYAPAESHAAYTRGPSNPGGGYHASSNPQPSYAQRGPRPEPAPPYRAPPPQYHAPAPQYHPPQAPRPAPAPHPQAQPHEQAQPRHGGADEHH
jgi:hypothetical protein